jgi:hypothetical protein
MHELFLHYANGVGIVGVILTLIAYYFLSVGKLDSDSLMYSLLNFIGSWLILFSLIFYWNLSSVVIEVAWISISMIGMYRYFRSRVN